MTQPTLRAHLHRTLTCLLIALLASPAWAGERRRLTWAQAAPLVQGSDVELRLTDYERVSGTALSADARQIRIWVERTSSEHWYPKGSHTISGSLLEEIRFRGKERRFMDPNDPAQITGWVAGGVGAAPLAFYLGEAKGVPDPLLAVLVIGAAVGGLLIARHVSSHRGSDLTIEIIHEAAPGEGRTSAPRW